MHAVVITEPGGPEVLRWTEVPDPVPGPGEVLIEVAAAGGKQGRHDAAPGVLPAAGGRAAVPGPRVLGHHRRPRRRA